MFKRFLSLLMAFALIMSLTSCWWKAKKVASVDTEKAAESDIEAENISTGTVESESETETETRGIPNAERETAISEISNTESEVTQIENKTDDNKVIGSDIYKIRVKEVRRNGEIIDINKKTIIKRGVVPNGLASLINNVKSIKSYSPETSVEEMDTIKFGSYPQSDESGSSKDPIEWIVLDIQDGKALLLSKYILDTKQYNAVEENVDITWKDCTLRNWLNTTFLNDAFSVSEQRSISRTTVENNDNKSHNTLGGEDTEDKIFILSAEEAYEYFTEPNKRGSRYKRLCTSGTNYARNVVNVDEKLRVGHEGDSFWLLRSVGEKQDRSKHVNADGVISPGGLPANNKFRGVRPAMWVTAESIQVELVQKDSLTLIQDNKYELRSMGPYARPQIKLSADEQKEVDKVVAEFKKKYIKNNMSDFEKEMTIIQYIVANVEYDLENYFKGSPELYSDPKFIEDYIKRTGRTNPDCYTAYGALVRGKAVCNGYANAFDVLCKACGLESEIVGGPTTFYGGGGHAWNRIKLDGEWYLVDTTWEDPVPYGNEYMVPPIWEQKIPHNDYTWEMLNNSWINRTVNDFPNHYNAQYNKPGNIRRIQFEVLNENGEMENKVDYEYYLDDSCTSTKYGPDAVAYYLSTGKVKTY